MAIKLVVTQPFADYAKGSEITDSAEMQRVQDEGLPVVRVTVPDELKTKADAPAA
jgi:hypothetical protein